MSLRRAEALALRRRLLIAEAALQRAHLRHETQRVVASLQPSAWAEQASQRWPWLSLAAALLLRRRGGPAFAVSALVLAWRWWRRLRRRRA